MTDDAPIPPRLPIPEADPKPWFASRTILASLAGLVLGLALVVIPSVLTLPAEVATTLIGLGATQITAAVAAIQGRIRAEQPIAPILPSRQG